jgi:hypothetical protein
MSLQKGSILIYTCCIMLYHVVTIPVIIRCRRTHCKWDVKTISKCLYSRMLKAFVVFRYLSFLFASLESTHVGSCEHASAECWNWTCGWTAAWCPGKPQKYFFEWVPLNPASRGRARCSRSLLSESQPRTWRPLRCCLACTLTCGKVMLAISISLCYYLSQPYTVMI